MNPRFLAVTSLLAWCANLVAGQEIAPGQSSQLFKKNITRSVETNYLLFLPEDYKADSTKHWPLILFLHGSGERGADTLKVKVHGPPKIAEKTPHFPFIVVSPQCPADDWWNNDLLEALLDDVATRYKVDTNRVYLTGLSMGGFGAFSLALHAPERFAAVAPICGGGDPWPPLGFDAKRMATLKALPFWVFHGDKDPAVPIAESERMVAALKKFGCDVQFTVYPGVGHDSWTATYDNPKLFEWFLEHERKQP